MQRPGYVGPVGKRTLSCKRRIAFLLRPVFPSFISVCDTDQGQSLKCRSRPVVGKPFACTEGSDEGDNGWARMPHFPSLSKFVYHHTSCGRREDTAGCATVVSAGLAGAYPPFLLRFSQACRSLVVRGIELLPNERRRIPPLCRRSQIFTFIRSSNRRTQHSLQLFAGISVAPPSAAVAPAVTQPANLTAVYLSFFHPSLVLRPPTTPTLILTQFCDWRKRRPIDSHVLMWLLRRCCAITAVSVSRCYEGAS